jgi:site-specific recombinase XerD
MNQVLTNTLKAVKLQKAEAEGVFCSRQGTPYQSFRTTFERAVRQAGIQDFTFHDLRHTFASRLVMAGVDLPTVQKLLGHKEITMTLRYAHLSNDHMQAAVKKLEKVPAIFTTPLQSQHEDLPQAIEK